MPSDDVLSEYRQARKLFAALVYCLTLIFVIFFMLCQFLLGTFLASLLPFGVLMLLASFILVTFFVFIEKIRFTPCINLIFTALIVLFVAFGHFPTWNWICFAVALAVMVLLIVIGTFMKLQRAWTKHPVCFLHPTHDLTMDVVIFLMLAMIVFVYAALFTIGIAAFNTTDHIAAMRIHIIIIALLVALIIMIFIMYHAQTIYGMRYSEMRTNDYLLGAIILYHDFILLMYCIWALYAVIGNFESDSLLDDSTTTTTTQKTR